MAVPDHDIERLLPVLVHVQTYLEQDLALERLTQLAHLSPSHFHRIVRATIGETLKQYTQWLRLERAAYHLRIRDETVLDIALNNGFHAHETFTRAFKRHFGTTPPAFRDRSVPFQIQATEYSLSAARVQHLAPIHIVVRRWRITTWQHPVHGGTAVITRRGLREQAQRRVFPAPRKLVRASQSMQASMLRPSSVATKAPGPASCHQG